MIATAPRIAKGTASVTSKGSSRQEESPVGSACRAEPDRPVKVNRAGKAKSTAAANVSSRQDEPTRRSRRAWAPSAEDHQIYQWVRFGGKTQGWVAGQLGISQATVSRVVQRFERWQAHADPRDGGQLDPAERARAQRWLTFERNEIVLASCLRIAQEMEGFTDVSKSVTRHAQSDPSQERDVRTEWSRVDRSGVAARFLRLAFRINMEQHKLVSSEPPALPQPLSDEEVAEQEAEAAAAQEEIEAARRASEARIRQIVAADMAANGEWEALRNLEAEGRESGVGGQQSEDGDRNSEPEAMHDVHKLHKDCEEEIAATNDPDTSCDDSCGPKKRCEGGCIASAGDRNATQRCLQRHSGR